MKKMVFYYIDWKRRNHVQAMTGRDSHFHTALQLCEKVTRNALYAPSGPKTTIYRPGAISQFFPIIPPTSP
jgi:hypothetical protein